MEQPTTKIKSIVLTVSLVVLFVVLINPAVLLITRAASSANFSSGNWNATSTWTGVNIIASTNPQNSENYGTWDGTNFWIGSFAQHRIYKISSDGLSYTSYQLDSSVKPLQLAWDGRYIWVGSADRTGQLVQFDPQSATVVNTYVTNPGSVGEGGIQGLLFDGTDLWVGLAEAYVSPSDPGGPGLVLKVDPSDGSVIGTVTNQLGVNGMVVDGPYIWVANELYLSKINRSDLTYSTTSAGLATYRLATDGTYIYGADYAEANIRKYRASDMSLVATWPSGTLLNSIAYDGKYLWVVGDNNRVTVQDPNTGAILYTKDNAGKSDLIWDGTYMWSNMEGVVTKLFINSLFPTGWPQSSDDATISTGTVYLTEDENVNNLTLAKGTLDLNGHALTVNGNLTLSGGSIDFANTNGSTINLLGNWTKTNSQSSLLNDTGLVNLISTTTQSIIGANTFYNLTKNTGLATLSFDSDNTTTITNTLSLSGSVGNSLSIEPSGSQHSLTYIKRFDGGVPAGFSDLTKIVRASNGDIYVLDVGTNVIYILDSNETLLKTIQLDGSISTYSLAVSANGTIYVPNANDDTIDIFNADGTASTTIALNPGDDPLDIAIAANGKIYVSEYAFSTSYIAIINPDGSIGTPINLAASWIYPGSMALAPDGTTYVADTNGGGDIYVSNPDGSASTTIVVDPSYFVQAISLDSHGVLWAADGNNHDIFSINIDGSVASTINLPGQNYFSYGLVVNSDGSFYSIGNTSSVDLFSSSGSFLKTFKNEVAGSFQDPDGIAYDSSGNMYVSDIGLDDVQKFDANDNFVRFLDPSVQLSNPVKITTDTSNDVYVVDRGNARIVKYDSSGNYLASTTIPSGNLGGIAVDGSGYIYLTNGGEIMKLDSNFNLVNSVTSANSVNFSTPVDIILAPGGNAIWVADYYSGLFTELNTSDLSYITSHFVPNISSQLYPNPEAIAFNSGGSVFVATESFGSSKVSVLDSNFNFLSNITYPGGSGDFGPVNELAVRPSGVLYVPDSGTHIVAEYNTVSPFTIISNGSANLANLSVVNSNNASLFVFACTNNCTDVGGNTNWVFTLSTSSPSNNNSGGGGGPVVIFSTPAPVATSSATTSTIATSTVTSTVSVATSTTATSTQATSTTATSTIATTTVISKPSQPASQEPQTTTQIQTSIPNENTALTETVTSQTQSNTGSGQVTVTQIGGQQNAQPATTTPTSIITAIQQNISDTYHQAVSIATGAAKATRAVVNTQAGSIVTKTISTIGIAAGAAASVSAVAFATPITFSEIWLLPIRLFGLLAGALGIRRKNRPWGTVYDSVTKQPIDPAYVSLIDAATEKEVASAVTDFDGRYGFLAAPGTYHIVAQKTDYASPSQKMNGRPFDEVYNDLYFGSPIVVSVAGELIAKNIPMDPIHFNWNEFVKKRDDLMHFVRGRDIVWAKISKYIFMAGAFAALTAVIFAPVPYNVIIAGAYIFAYILNFFVFAGKKAGALLDLATGKPLSFALIKIYQEGQSTPFATKVADALGRYYALIPNGHYSISIERKNDDETYTQILKTDSIDITRGIINQDWTI